MTLLTWSDEYKIDVSQIDEEHEQLFEVINDLHQAMKSGDGREKVGAALENLEDYVEYHFNSERDLAKDCGFSHDCGGCHEAHQDAHNAFEQKVRELQEEHENGSATVHMETMQFVKKWITEHIGGMDQQLGYYINDEKDPEELEPKSMNYS